MTKLAILKLQIGGCQFISAMTYNCTEAMKNN